MDSRAGAWPPCPQGRRISTARRRLVLVAVRLTLAESADWRAKAKAAGVALSALVHRAMARTRTWTARAPEVERERTRRVFWIGNNHNQIARSANTHKGAANVDWAAEDHPWEVVEAGLTQVVRNKVEAVSADGRLGWLSGWPEPRPGGWGRASSHVQNRRSRSRRDGHPFAAVGASEGPRTYR